MTKQLILFVVIFFSLQSSFAQKFKSEELFIESFDSVRISGTLIIPNKLNEHHPIAIIIAGSGPTDRDGNSGLMVNNSLKYLAEGLAKNKIASFRYDKRAIGKSLSSSIKETDLRFEDYVNDVKALIKDFKKDDRFSEVIIIGHSEGSLLGMIAVQNTNVKKYVSVSGVGRTADLILKDQLSQQYGIKTITPILDSLKSGYMVSNLGKLKTLFRPSVQPYMISWFKYNPQKEIKGVTCPVLILQGDNDIQVKVKEADLLKNAKPSADYKIISGMNHIMKIIKGNFNDNLKSYYNPDLPDSKSLVSTISKFINKH